MSGEPEIHLDLVLRPEDRTVTGVIRSESGASEVYTGWIGLLAALKHFASDSTEGRGT